MNNTLQPPHVVAQARIKELEGLIRELLLTTELNLDEMEEETVAVIDKAFKAITNE